VITWWFQPVFSVDFLRENLVKSRKTNRFRPAIQLNFFKGGLTDKASLRRNLLRNRDLRTLRSRKSESSNCPRRVGCEPIAATSVELLDCAHIRGSCRRVYC
jgi:hypothetical protein